MIYASCSLEELRGATSHGFPSLSPIELRAQLYLSHRSGLEGVCARKVTEYSLEYGHAGDEAWSHQTLYQTTGLASSSRRTNCVFPLTVTAISLAS